MGKPTKFADAQFFYPRVYHCVACHHKAPLLPASSAPTVALFHGFRHVLADLGLAGVKTASPERLVHMVDSGTFLSMGLSSFKSILASFYNIPALGAVGL